MPRRAATPPRQRLPRQPDRLDDGPPSRDLQTSYREVPESRLVSLETEILAIVSVAVSSAWSGWILVSVNTTGNLLQWALGVCDMPLVSAGFRPPAVVCISRQPGRG